ncbi:MAG: hypothetical protein HUU55_23785 [Myxococcales bacterium]|nr:hypothetical protein [Myxococcales bacterium]
MLRDKLNYLLFTYVFVVLFVLTSWSTDADASCLTPAGDVTGDGVTSVVDVQCLIVLVIYELNGKFGAPPTCLGGADFATSDQNCDSTTNVTDIQLGITFVLGTGLDPAIDSNGDD